MQPQFLPMVPCNNCGSPQTIRADTDEEEIYVACDCQGIELEGLVEQLEINEIDWEVLEERMEEHELQ